MGRTNTPTPEAEAEAARLGFPAPEADSFDQTQADAIAAQQGSVPPTPPPQAETATGIPGALHWFRTNQDPGAVILWEQNGSARSGIDRIAGILHRAPSGSRVMSVVTATDSGHWQAYAEVGAYNGGDSLTGDLRRLYEL